jgi:hypothetical protein
MRITRYGHAAFLTLKVTRATLSSSPRVVVLQRAMKN